ncbi:MAG: A24 family peptidase [Bifidobacteriaceae bacterium]|jgi:leader peptidase (prepilin peptidase)/N-methyltransferase|nr:A24 family peptidase [Bifidobacteriaceae bacterium]
MLGPFAWAAMATLAVAAFALSAIDLRTRRLPDVIVLPALVAVTGLLAADAARAGVWWPWRRAVLCCVVSALGHWLVWRVARGGLGLGDVKLAGLLAFGLGYLGVAQVVLGVVAAFVLGALAGLVLAWRSRRWDNTLAFGPWMCLGALLAVVIA